jgi:hypothetical protein
MTQFTSYDQVGKKEDVSDLISNISPTKVPFQTMIGSEKVTNTLFQWQEDSLRAVQVNAKVEGFTASDASLSPTVMRNNYTQILEKTIKVSDTADSISTYGRARESAYQLAKAGFEVKRDLEFAMVGTGQTAVAGDSSTARKFNGYQAQIDTALINYTGAGNALTEDALLTTLQELYAEGADPSIIMVTPANSVEVAKFAKAAGRYREIENDGRANKTIINAVDLYVSPFGEQRVVLNRFQMGGNSGDANVDTLVFDPDMWKTCVLRPWTRETLAKDGDNTKMMLVGEYSLKHKNKKASAVIRNGAAP